MMVNKEDARAPVDKPGAGRGAEAKAEASSPAPGPGAGCLSSKQILRAMVVGIFGSEREHVLNCLPCLDRLRHIDKVSFKSGSDFVRRMLASIEPDTRAGWDRATVNPAAFHAIFAAGSRLQKLNPVSLPGQVFKVELVPLFDLEPFGFDKKSFELQGALQTGTIEAIEKVDVSKDGKCDFIRLTFSSLKPSGQVAAAVSARRPIFDTLRLVGQVQGEHNKKFYIIAQASLEFKGR
jgi:hypothetical protein